MQKIIITLGFCFLCFCVSAQTKYSIFKDIKGVKKVVADTVITRVAPSTGAAFDDTLYIGNTVEVLMEVPYTEVRNNIVSPWLKVMYKKGKYNKIGFISAIDLALNTKLSYKNFDFFWGVTGNNKKDSFINNELATSNNYQCKLAVMKDGNLVTDYRFMLTHEQGVDSFSLALLKTSRLAKTQFTIEFTNYSLKDSTKKEYYTHSFVVCQNNNIVELPLTHNYLVKPKVGFPVSLITYKSKNKFLLRTEFLQIFSETIVDTYKWNDCSYELVK